MESALIQAPSLNIQLPGTFLNISFEVKIKTKPNFADFIE
jgi:hypothetical protein